MASKYIELGKQENNILSEEFLRQYLLLTSDDYKLSTELSHTYTNVHLKRYFGLSLYSKRLKQSIQNKTPSIHHKPVSNMVQKL